VKISLHLRPEGVYIFQTVEIESGTFTEYHHVISI